MTESIRPGTILSIHSVDYIVVTIDKTDVTLAPSTDLHGSKWIRHVSGVLEGIKAGDIKIVSQPPTKKTIEPQEPETLSLF